ncbi:MAG: SDR family oxidoreductase [Candidatus Omnitrophota bacterium]
MPKPAALITGGAKRIGQAISLSLAQLGFDIALHYNRSRKEAENTASQIRKTGVHCEIFKADLENGRETLALIAKVSRRFPKLSLLVNSASIFKKSKLTTDNLKLFNMHFSINFKAPYILSCDFAKICKSGQIINILDTHITTSKTTYPAYLLSKKLLGEFTSLAALQFAPKIRVNAIAPGLILAPAAKDETYLKRLAQNIPLKKRGNPTNITHAIQFLLENGYVSGQTIFIDGGEHLLS